MSVDVPSVARSVKNIVFSGVGAEPYLKSSGPWPSSKQMTARAEALMNRAFRSAVPGRERPRAIVTIGVMGSGKSTAVKRLARGWKPAIIDADAVCYEFLAGSALPRGGSSLYDLMSLWTARVFKHAVDGRYNLVYDSPVPTSVILRTLRRAGYRIEMMLVRASQKLARKREVARDLGRGWGRPGRTESSHIGLARYIAVHGPSLARRYAATLTVCDNSGKGVKCRSAGDPRRIPSPQLAHFFRG